MKTIFQLIVGIAICFAVAILLRINPSVEYGWFMGAIHGFLFVPNWLISLFDPSWIYKAPLHTSVYNIDWWVCCILDVIYWLWAIVGAIVTVVRNH